MENPISSVLADALHHTIRRRGLVLWFDPQLHYSLFVERLQASSPPYEIVSFKGSYLAWMFETESLALSQDPTPMLLYLPGFSNENIKETPMLELYLAGTRFERDLPTVITEGAAGKVRPEQIAAFLETKPTLEAADAWLQGLLSLQGGGLGAQLRAMQVTAVFDDLLSNGPLSLQLPHALEPIWEAMVAWTGVSRFWHDCTMARPEDLVFSVASWALGMEYVSDLRREPVNALLRDGMGLPKPVMEVNRSIALHLRERHPAFYKKTAQETEALLFDEEEAAKAEDLGEIDTFRFEDLKVLEAAFAALGAGDYEKVLAWGGQREGSFWLKDDINRRSAWDLLLDAARLGGAIVREGRLGAGSLDGALRRYMEVGAGVDQAHRYLEQRRVSLLYPQIPEYEVLRVLLDQMRGRWRQWADAWARAFAELCQREGFLPPAALQQRTLFDDVLRPLTQDPGITALFLVDALRFEMGEELYRALQGAPEATVSLAGRFAELPTLTSVGMNALAPVSYNGRLRPSITDGDFGGFSTGEFRVMNPETRRRAMHDRVGGATCPVLSLDEVINCEMSLLRRKIAQARLVVVHSQEIDQAGEAGAGPALFDQAMQKLRAAWRMLRDAGVRKFVFTADHGFLLVEGADAGLSHGRKTDPKRRYAFSSVPVHEAGKQVVALGELAYDAAGGFLVFPETTAVFDRGLRSENFVHGGNSLQERVIPVVSVVHRAVSGGSLQSYEILAQVRDGVGGMHCLEVRVQAAGGLSFGGREVELGLLVRDGVGVQVKLCQTRGAARIVQGVVLATVGASFELFFQLSGPVDARVLVELYHPSASVEVVPCVLEERFAVQGEAEAVRGPSVGRGWLASLPEGGIRQVFDHLSVHGAITESEATQMLGGTRAFRRFSLDFESYAKKAPFSIRIDTNGTKRYVREG